MTTKGLERPGWLGRQQSEVTEESGFDCSHVADKLRCLCLFSGKRRVGDLRECLAASRHASHERNRRCERQEQPELLVGEVAECAFGGGGCWEVRFGGRVAALFHLLQGVVGKCFGSATAAIAAASTWVSVAFEVGTCSSGFVESAGGLHDQAARSASGKRSQAHAW